jgi:XapX domain-containing protein
LRTNIFQSIASLGTGLVVGLLFALLRLPVPAPPAIPAVMGILGITIGYLLFQRWFGS